MQAVTSKDGTKIAYDKAGKGPAVILIAGAFSYRKFPATVKISMLLEPYFTVYNYDRRGRGDSSDTMPYAIKREIEDIQALIDVAGGSAYVWGLSSGAALALHAAASSLNITKLALHEPPFVVDPSDRRPPVDFTAHVTKLIAEDKRGDAVTYFMRDVMGAPGFVIPLMHLMPGMWSKLTAVAQTLPYDAQLVDGFQSGKPLPSELWRSVTMPTIVMSGPESPPLLVHAAEVLAKVLPNAKLVSKKGLGHTKQLSAKVIAPVLIDFFRD
ncbi:MAG: hydrolase [Candidatus Saccharibacteria bacterium]|nr:hydrolase [Candidatus Saccharibacteria bacterium]